MFIVSKIFALFTQPLFWVVTLMVLGWLTLQRKPVLGQRLVACALVVLIAIGWQPPPEYLIRLLERQHTEFDLQANLSGFVGVIVLGGGTASGRVAQVHRQALLSDAAERLTAPIAMRQHNPHLRVVYTGGEGELLGTGPSEAERARTFFESMGLTNQQVVYESASRNTYENAVLTAQLPGIDPKQRWLLVTSATHMPRAMATFTKVGWNVTAYPVDFRTGDDTPWTSYSMRSGVEDWQLSLHEWLGLLAYRVTGRM